MAANRGLAAIAIARAVSKSVCKHPENHFSNRSRKRRAIAALSLRPGIRILASYYRRALKCGTIFARAPQNDSMGLRSQIHRTSAFAQHRFAPNVPLPGIAPAMEW